MAKEKKRVVVTSQERLSDDICSMWLEAGSMVSGIRPGRSEERRVGKECL